LPIQERTYTPLTFAGGIAGGEKYLIHGILFKLALDFQGVYGGDDAAAAAAAAHELKGGNALMVACGSTDPGKYYASCKGGTRAGGARASSSCPPPLHFALQACVDYRGQRLIASSLLPIRPPSSLAYGVSSPSQLASPAPIPCGAGDPPLLAAMTSLAALLNLAPHRVGLPSNSALLAHPADLEAHRPLPKGRVYVLDTARALPPEHREAGPRGSPGPRGSHLSRLLRPEFVRRWHVPLSPDALSRFTVPGERAGELRAVRAASEYLVAELIPKFAASFLARVTAQSLPCDAALLGSLGECMKRSGINMRHLGLLRRKVPEASPLSALLLAEMVARVAKTDVRGMWREAAEKAEGLPRFDEYDKITVRYAARSQMTSPVRPRLPFFWRSCRYLNNLLGPETGQSETYWTGVLQMRVMSKYEAAFSENELSLFSLSSPSSLSSTPPFRSLLLPYLPTVYERAKQMLGLEIDPIADQELKRGEAPPLEHMDLLSIKPKTKLPTIALVAKAMELVEAAKTRGGGSLRLWRMAEKALVEAVCQSTLDSSILANLAGVYCVMAELLHEAGAGDALGTRVRKYVRPNPAVTLFSR
jgi:hypothetical protein